MSAPISGISIYMIPGQSAKIKSALTNRNNYGWFAAKKIPSGYFNDLPYASTILNGFVVEDERNGTISPDSDDPGAVVIYTHNRVAENAIWFFASSGERGLVNVISVPIHDHSTIVHGGPAYGTYYDDDIER